jgi:2-dehydro-3-deoxyphosphogluconate aldolase/(4S)-4-hydroxy-2-oxoglutarate aldolase
MAELDDILDRAPVIPVVEIAREDDAEPLADALLAGGLPVVEITLRTEAALPAIARLRERTDIIVGAGTVLDPTQLKHALDAGAKFIVSPGLTEPLASAAKQAAIPFLPGVATAGEIMRGLDLGLTSFKFFPAETSGGAPAVAAFAGPFRGVRFCPTGGITATLAPNYLALGNVACVGGTWVASRAAIATRDWSAITALAKTAAAMKRAT